MGARHAVSMDKSNPKKAAEPYELINWVLLRKLETFVFAFLFLALPFFAFRVVDATTSTLAVRNTAAELVQDLIKWKKTAEDDKTFIQVTTRPTVGHKGFAYVVKQGERSLEEVLLPPGVAIVGTVVFDGEGMPKSAATFVITKGSKSVRVEVDPNGLITAP